MSKTATAPPTTVVVTEKPPCLPATVLTKPAYKPQPWGDYVPPEQRVKPVPEDKKLAAKVRRKAVQMGLVKPKPKLTVEAILRKALAAFGPNGERWTKRRLRTKRNPKGGFFPEEHFCALGGISFVLNSRAYPEGNGPRGLAAKELQAALPSNHYSVPSYNDDDHRSFDDIRALYERAIQSAAAKEI